MGATKGKVKEAVLVQDKEDKCVLAFQAHSNEKIPGFHYALKGGAGD